MKLRKAIKRIVALGLGVSMVGATLMGAAAANLNAYPAPFVQNGKFSGYLVVGDNAAAQDVIGVSDIAMSLQAAAFVATGTGTTSSSVLTGDGYQFTKSSDKLNLYQDIEDIKSTLTSEDLAALADGTFTGKTTESYKQTLRMQDGFAQVQWTTFSDVSDDPALYLKFNASREALNYKLSFDTGPASDLDSNNRMEDWEDNKITILGKQFTVTKSEYLAANTTKLTLMAGSVQDTLEVGQTKTYTVNGKDYEVTVMVVSGDTAATALTKLIVNDEVTKSLSADQTFTLKDGTDISIKEVLPTKSGDAVQNLVEFYLGADKIVLDGSDNGVDIGDRSDLSGVNCSVSTTLSGSTEVKLNTIEMIFAPSSAMYVPVGGTLKGAAELDEETDYVALLDKLGLDYQFSGISAGNTETVEMKRNDDNSIKLEFTNKAGIDYSVPIIYMTGSTARLGKDATEILHIAEAGANNLTTSHQGTTLACDESMFLLENDDTTRIMQVKDVKNTSSSHYIKLKDMGTGSTTNYNFNDNTGVAELNLDGYTYQVKVETVSTGCINLTETTDNADHIANIWTKYGSEINLSFNYYNNTLSDGRDTQTIGYPVTLVEDKDQQEDDNSRDIFQWNFTWDSTNSVVNFVGDVVESNELAMATLDADSKKSEGYSKWGTFFERNTNGDQDTWKITIPEEEVEAEVYLTAGAVDITKTGTVSGTQGILNKIDVGATKLASEVAGMEKTTNLILVGGPCANAAVEAASSSFPACSTESWTLEPGEGIIQMVEQADGSVAMLIAGTTAADTRTASTVVAEKKLLKELPDGVSKQLVRVVSGQSVLTDVPEVTTTTTTEETTEDTEGTA